jgi:cell wall-associated NlpC family hydrolase
VSTIAWLFILVGFLVARFVFKGRVMNIGQDLSDTFQAIISGNSDSLAEVLARTGDSVTPDQATFDLGTGSLTQVRVGNVTNGKILAAAHALAAKAKGYRFGAAGPTYYDCSGLVYRAVQTVGYTGPRFFTSTVKAMPGFHTLDTTKDAPQVDDIVLWVGHHMGIVSGGDTFFSARSVKSGIKDAAISTFGSSNGWSTPPVYLRFSTS